MNQSTILSSSVCDRSVSEVVAAGIDKVVANDSITIWNAFFAAECSRRRGKIKLAAKIITAIQQQPITREDASIAAAVKRHRTKLDRSDRTPIDETLVAQYPPHLPEPVEADAVSNQSAELVTSTPDPTEPELPSIWIRGWNFSRAMARWAGSGCKMRTTKEISKRLTICQSCPFLKNNVCTHAKCGCNCNEKNQVLNKLALATEKCPDGRWS